MALKYLWSLQITDEGEAETKQAIDLRVAYILAEAIKSAAEAEYKEFNVTKG